MMFMFVFLNVFCNYCLVDVFDVVGECCVDDFGGFIVFEFLIVFCVCLWLCLMCVVLCLWVDVCGKNLCVVLFVCGVW